MPARTRGPSSSPDIRAGRPGGTVRLVAGLVSVFWSVTLSAAQGPAHRQHHPQPPSAERDDVTATIPSTKAQPLRDRKVAPHDDETLPEPFHLPTASRERMHDCGMKWQGLKTAGETGDETWREFATICLASTDGNREKTAP